MVYLFIGALPTFGALDEATATSYTCSPIPLRVMQAEAVVVGRTISVEQRPFRPDRPANIFRFRIEQVIKNTDPPLGELLVEESLPRLFIGGSHLPPPQWGRSVVFLHGGDGALRAGPCGISADTADLAHLARIAEVAALPNAHLASADQQIVEVILYWIQLNYFSPNDPYLEQAAPEIRSQLSRESAVDYVLHQVDVRQGPLYELAIDLLARFHPPECFERLATALASSSPRLIRSASAGLGRLGDLRAVPLLIERLQRLRVSRSDLVEKLEDAWTPEGQHYQKKVMRPDDTYDQAASAVIEALGRLGDPRAADELLLALDVSHYHGAASALAEFGDARAIEPLLRLLWQDKISFTPLLKFSDSRILAEARARLYDHPRAPTLLAAAGDPTVRKFMLRLLQQGHQDAALWAGVARAAEAQKELLRVFHSGDGMAGTNAAYALGRLRAFEVIPEALDLTPERDIHAAAKRGYFLIGLTDADLYTNPMQSAEFLDYAAKHLSTSADLENWDEEARALAARLRDAVEEDWSPSGNRYPILELEGPWVPPVDFPDMPDPLDAKAVGEFLRRNIRRLSPVLRSAPPKDRVILLHALNGAGLNISEDLFVTLSLHPHRQVRGAAGSFVRNRDIRLSGHQLERWALSDDFAATRSALFYVQKNARKEYQEVVAQVLQRGRHLYDENLYRAIIAVQATQCVPQLKGYLDGCHIDLRRRAAYTLAFLGDGSGRQVLLQEHRRKGQVLGANEMDYIQRALKLLGHEDN